MKLTFCFNFQVIKAFIIPRIKVEGERLRACFEGPILSNIDKIAAEHIKQLILVGWCLYQLVNFLPAT